MRTSFSGATLAAPVLRSFRFRKVGYVRARSLHFAHGGGQPASNVLRRLLEWIIVEVSITLGRRRLSVTQQLAYDWQSKTGAGTNRCMGMPQIVDPDAFEASTR